MNSDEKPLKYYQDYLKSFKWKKIRTFGKIPSARSSFAYSNVNVTKVFIHGGCDEDYDLSDAFILNLETFKWKEAKNFSKNLNKPLVGHSAVTVTRSTKENDQYIFMFGGWNGSTYSKSGYLLETNHYEYLESYENWLQSPSPRRDHTCVYNELRQKYYLFGGWNPVEWNYTDTLFNELYLLDPWWKWTKEEVYGEMPCARRGHSCIFSVIPEECIILFGGVYGYNRFLDDLFILRIEEKKWEKIEAGGDLPSKRAWHTASLIGSKFMFIFGGMFQNSTYSNEVFCLSVKDMFWIKLEFDEKSTVPEPCCSHAALSIRESIIVFGGVSRDTNSDINARDNINEDRGSIDSSMSSDDLEIEDMPETKRVAFDYIYVLEKEDSLENYLQIINKKKENVRQEDARSETAKNLKGVSSAGNLSPRGLELKNEIELSKMVITPPPLPQKLLTKETSADKKQHYEQWNPLMFPDTKRNTAYNIMKAIFYDESK